MKNLPFSNNLGKLIEKKRKLNRNYDLRGKAIRVLWNEKKQKISGFEIYEDLENIKSDKSDKIEIRKHKNKKEINYPEIIKMLKEGYSIDDISDFENISKNKILNIMKKIKYT